MVSSTEIPKAILNTRMVEGLMGTPRKPMSPAVMSRGKRFGINDMAIILTFRNIQPIRMAIKKIASDRDKIRLLTRYLVPFSKIKAFPVSDTS